MRIGNEKKTSVNFRESGPLEYVLDNMEVIHELIMK